MVIHPGSFFFGGAGEDRSMNNTRMYNILLFIYRLIDYIYIYIHDMMR